MKRLILLSGIILFLFTVVGCEKKEATKPKEISLKLDVTDFSHSDCKGGNLNRVKAIEIPQEYLEIKALDNNLLGIKHINVLFNCCPGELIVKSEINNDTIIINEYETEIGCKCNCRYDLDYKLGTLEYAKYHIILNKKSNVYFKFDLNFNEATNEKILVKQIKKKE